MVGWGWCFQVCASSELQFGGLREGGGTREAGSTISKSLVVLYQGRAEPLCARIESANRKVSEGKAYL